jgi:hypothetical protein
MLDAVLLAEAKDHANWAGLAKLAESLPDGEAKDAFTEAVERVLPQEDEHLGWATEARNQLIAAQAESKAVQTVGEAAEKAVERIQAWLA